MCYRNIYLNKSIHKLNRSKFSWFWFAMLFATHSSTPICSGSTEKDIKSRTSGNIRTHNNIANLFLKLLLPLSLSLFPIINGYLVISSATVYRRFLFLFRNSFSVRFTVFVSKELIIQNTFALYIWHVSSKERWSTQDWNYRKSSTKSLSLCAMSLNVVVEVVLMPAILGFDNVAAFFPSHIWKLDTLLTHYRLVNHWINIRNFFVVKWSRCD